VNPFSLFLPLRFSLSQSFEVLCDVLFNSRSLQGSQTLLQQIHRNIEVVLKHTGKDEIFELSHISFELLDTNLLGKLNLNSDFAANKPFSETFSGFERVRLILARSSYIRQVNSVELSLFSTHGNVIARVNFTDSCSV
jgi:hypothetical protein